MNTYIDEYTEQFDKAIEHLKSELLKIRAGVANPSMIENVKINAYNTLTPLMQVASITVPDAKTLLVQPWDKSVIKNIEKGLRDAGTGLNPINEGDKIRIVIPPLMEETRKTMIKFLKDKAEETRIVIRGLRDKVKESIITAQRQSEITEDEKFIYIKKLDEFTSKHNEEIKKLIEHKEKTIMTV